MLFVEIKFTKQAIVSILYFTINSYFFIFALKEGDEFKTKEELIEKLYFYSLENNFSFIIVRSDSHAYYAKCKNDKCPYIVKAHESNDHKGSGNRYFYITKIVEPHTCQCESYIKDNRVIKLKIHKKFYESVILRNTNKSIKSIQDDIRQNYGLKTNSSSVFRMKQSILKQYEYNDENFYKFVESFTNFINYSGGLGILEKSEDSRFFRVFIGLQYSRNIFLKIRKFISLDGCIIKNKYKNTLLLAVALDADEHIIILVYAIVQIENWYFFLQNLRILLNYTNYSDYCFISDRDKGLQSALPENFPDATITTCLRHFVANIKSKVKDKKLLFTFWQAALTFNNFLYYSKMRYLSFHNNIYQLIESNSEQWPDR